MAMSALKTALILGATGGIGHEVAIALRRHGWQINALHRDPAKAAAHAKAADIRWVKGDAMDAAEVTNAARGASVIVHAVNPPGYRNWGQLVLPMVDNSISAARACGARIVLPGTIYNYGPDAFPTLREDSPQNPLTRKGKIRVELERRLRTAADTGVRSLIVRAGDFFGPAAGNSWFSQGLLGQGKPVTSIMYPGRPGMGHAWAYLPDLAETLARLVDRDSTLGTFERFHFGGHWDNDGTQMTHVIQAVVGRPNIPVRRFPWPVVTLLSPFKTLFREMREMRYLWGGAAAVEQRATAERAPIRAPYASRPGNSRNTDGARMPPNFCLTPDSATAYTACPGGNGNDTQFRTRIGHSAVAV
jgi:nucleoside-diphosphate-sugar epimerase